MDIELVRSILIAIDWAETDGKQLTCQELAISIGHPVSFQFHSHVNNLIDGGYVKANDNRISGLSFKGNDFLSLLSNEDIWQEVQEKLKLVGGSSSLGIVQKLATKIICDKLGI